MERENQKLLEKITKDLEKALAYRIKADEDNAQDAYNYWDGQVYAYKNMLEYLVA